MQATLLDSGSWAGMTVSRHEWLRWLFAKAISWWHNIPAMATVRVLHTSDLHLCSDHSGTAAVSDDRCYGLAPIIRVAVDVRADLLLVAGDMFDSPRVPDDLVRPVVRHLQSLPCPVVVLPGNHDCLVPDSVYLRNDLFEMAPNVHVMLNPAGETVSFPDLDLSVWGRPHVNYADFSPLGDIPPRGTEKWQLAMAHGFFVESGSHLNRGWKITDAELFASRRDYVALGHIEQFSRVGNNGAPAYYSGSPGRTHSVLMVELDDVYGVRVTQVGFPALSA